MKTKPEWTPLMVAAQHNTNVDVLRTLIRAGIDVNAKGPGGTTALMLAARHNPNLDVLHALLEAGADVGATSDAGLTALMLAVKSTVAADAIGMLVDAGSAVNARSAKGNTALMLAASTNPSEDLVQALLRGGADPLVTRSDGWTALMIAVKHGASAGVVGALANAASSASPSSGHTPSAASGDERGRVEQRKKQSAEASTKAAGVERGVTQPRTSAVGRVVADASGPAARILQVLDLDQLSRIPPLGTYDGVSDPTKIRMAHKISGGKRMVWIFEGSCRVRAGSKRYRIACAEYAAKPHTYDLVDVDVKVMAVEVDPYPHMTGGEMSLLSIVDGSWSNGAPVVRVTEEDEWAMSMGYHLRDVEHQIDVLIAQL